MRKTLAVLTLALLLIATTIGAYYNFIYLPEKRLEERIQPLIDTGLTREKALEFDEAYRNWAPYNETAKGYARYWVDYLVISEAILKTSGSLTHAGPSLDLIVPNIANKTLTQNILTDFMVKHTLLVKDDGLNATDIRLIKYYTHFRGIVDKVIEKIGSQEDRLFALEELTPYISKPLTEEQAYRLIEKWYPELFKKCKEKKMSIVFGDLDEDGVNHYEEIFTYGTDPIRDDWPPLIKDLKWEPTRVVNSKVYDGIVNFVAEDPKLSEVYLIFEPKNYTHLPNEAFPKEASRRFSLKPVDGAFDEKIEEFLANVTDIKGGREYEIKVIAKDKAGNIATASLVSPYIREFENIAPLDDIIVVAPYYLWYRIDKSNWKDGHKYMPLLGEYTSNDPLIMSKHVDWATGRGGIDVFLVSWTGYESEDLKFFDDNLKLLFENHLSQDIYIGILYESGGRLKTTGNPQAPWEKNVTDPENLQILLSDFGYLAKTYFKREHYFKIDSKPFVYLYDSAAFIGDVKTAMIKLREHVKNVSEYEIYLVSDHVHPYVLPGDNEDWEAKAKQFDGITCWLGGYSGEGEYLGGSYEKQLEILYSEWGGWAKENRKKVIPYATPEFDGRYVSWGDLNSVPLERLPKLFEERISIILKYAEKPRMIFIGTWNDFFESTTLEPAHEYKFDYLYILSQIFQRYRVR